MNIAIDGPAGAGKSTIAKRVAGELSFIYVDTGAMYRAIAVYLLRQGITEPREHEVSDVIKDISVDIGYDDGTQQVYLNGENVTGQLRTEATGNMASKASALSCVREKLLMLQRDIAAANDVVMDGRDIGTNILPNAELKIYLTASVSVRAKRRFDELAGRGETAGMAQIEADIETRDRQDMTRSIAPLMQADDAVLIDSSDMTIDEVAGKIIALARDAQSKAGA